MEVRRGIEVSGVVQGVGFRPYVYRLATEHRLAGSIANTSSGVAIEVQGEPQAVDDFIGRLPVEAPPLAHITDVEVRDLACAAPGTFQILASRADAPARTLISPDVAICDACLHELFDPRDRRYRYPFINCTDCGPRFTIVRDVPYDRPRTSMAAFVMCPACQAEYDDPASRRFHAQPNACWDCGPRVELWGPEGRKIEAGEPVAAAVEHLAAGGVVAVKGLGGFHLAVDAGNAEAVEGLRARKRRVAKPFAVMTASLEAAARLARLDAETAAALRRPERPIVLVPKAAATPTSEAVAPGVREVGIFLPYTALHHLLFARAPFEALVMTSGNLSEEPIAVDNHEAVARLRGLADLFLVHDRDILRRCDDSVVRVAGGRTRSLRRSRGYVPLPVFLDEEVPAVLAVGGELKSTVCLTRGRQAFLSQHLGDLENLEAYAFFEEAALHLQRILEVEPRAIAHDLHPDYLSSRWALEAGLSCVGVQHHHAHIASCMAENGLRGRVIGLALDGTGYGTDGRIWGGEVLVAGYAGFERAGHLAEVPLPGGAAAIREPWRMALSYLWRHFGPGFLEWNLPLVTRLDHRAVDTVLAMVTRGVRSPLTSSCGRLFDAVSALLGVCDRATYEGQPAIELEAVLADDGAPSGDAYPFELERDGTVWVIGTRGLFEALVKGVRSGVPPGVASRRFHDGLSDALARVAVHVRERTGLERVCLSGGSFQNQRLSHGLKTRLERDGFRVFTHGQVPAGDGGLSLGQAMVAAHRLRFGAV